MFPASCLSRSRRRHSCNSRHSRVDGAAALIHRGIISGIHQILQLAPSLYIPKSRTRFQASLIKLLSMGIKRGDIFKKQSSPWQWVKVFFFFYRSTFPPFLGMLPQLFLDILRRSKKTVGETKKEGRKKNLSLLLGSWFCTTRQKTKS